MNSPEITATVVTGSHHGARSHGSNHKNWIDRIRAKAVVYTSGFKYGHPKCTAVKRFRQYLANVPPHEFTCDAAEDKDYETSSLAEYETEVLGDISITTNGLSPFRIDYSVRNCSSYIAH